MSERLLIWLVDDDVNEHLLARSAFKAASVPNELRTFGTAQDTLKELDTVIVPKLPHVILCDVKMPCMDGFEFLVAIRKSRWRAMPVALFSNSNIQADIDRGYELGANAFHVKSSTQEQLRACVDTICEFWARTVAMPSLGTHRVQLPH